MKMAKKKLTNKDFENRDNVLMMELENLRRIVDSMFMTIINYIEYKGDIENLKKLLTEIDLNKAFNPATIIAFGYNFESKVLREKKTN